MLNNPTSTERSREDPDAAFKRDIVQLPEGEGYNLTVGKTPKFIWYRNAKVATRTTLSTFDQAGLVYQVRQVFRAHYSPDDLAEYYKFAFVRNPWDRLVSSWLNKINNGKTLRYKKFGGDRNDFEAFVTFLETQDLTQCNNHFRLQTRLVPLNTIDFLGRFETFENDLKMVLTRLGLKADMKLERKNYSKNRRPYQDYYTPDIRDRVTCLYQPDIEALGYKF